MGTSWRFSKRPEGGSGRIEKVQEMPVPCEFGRLDVSGPGISGERSEADIATTDGNGTDEPAQPQAQTGGCAHCGRTAGGLNVYRTTGTDGRVNGSVTLHPHCKDQWTSALWAKARARQNEVDAVRPGKEVEI